MGSTLVWHQSYRKAFMVKEDYTLIFFLKGILPLKKNLKLIFEVLKSSLHFREVIAENLQMKDN